MCCGDTEGVWASPVLPPLMNSQVLKSMRGFQVWKVHLRTVNKGRYNCVWWCADTKVAFHVMGSTKNFLFLWQELGRQESHHVSQNETKIHLMVQKNMRLVGDAGTGTILSRYPKIPLDRRYSQESITSVLLITGSASERETIHPTFLSTNRNA
jgi:hypothetical protein